MIQTTAPRSVAAKGAVAMLLASAVLSACSSSDDPEPLRIRFGEGGEVMARLLQPEPLQQASPAVRGNMMPSIRLFQSGQEVMGSPFEPVRDTTTNGETVFLIPAGNVPVLSDGTATICIDWTGPDALVLTRSKYSDLPVANGELSRLAEERVPDANVDPNSECNMDVPNADGSATTPVALVDLDEDGLDNLSELNLAGETLGTEIADDADRPLILSDGAAYRDEVEYVLAGLVNDGNFTVGSQLTQPDNPPWGSTRQLQLRNSDDPNAVPVEGSAFSAQYQVLEGDTDRVEVALAIQAPAGVTISRVVLNTAIQPTIEDAAPQIYLYPTSMLDQHPINPGLPVEISFSADGNDATWRGQILLDGFELSETDPPPMCVADGAADDITICNESETNAFMDGAEDPELSEFVLNLGNCMAVVAKVSDAFSTAGLSWELQLISAEDADGNSLSAMRMLNEPAESAGQTSFRLDIPAVVTNEVPMAAAQNSELLFELLARNDGAEEAGAIFKCTIMPTGM